MHPQLVGSPSESVFNLLSHQTRASNRNKILAYLEAQSIIRPRRQTSWSSGLDKLTQGDRLQHARQLEREVKAISPNLLRYNRYLQINRDLVYLHKENIQKNAIISKINSNQQIKLNLIQPIKEKLNISNSALAQRRLFQPITSNVALFLSLIHISEHTRQSPI